MKTRLIESLGLGVAVALTSGVAFGQPEDEDASVGAESDAEEVPDSDEGESGSMDAPVEEEVAFSTKEPPPEGMTFQVGLRLGYGLPSGQAHEGSDLGSTYTGHIPVVLEFGLKATPNVLIGLYAQYGFGLMASDICPDDDCGGSVNRVGLQAHYEFSPGEFVNPWLGLGVGYEWAYSSGEVQYSAIQVYDTEVTLSGFEFVNLQGGALFRVMPELGVGPFVGVSAGMYTGVKAEVEGNDPGWDFGDELGDSVLHQWITFGVRGTYEFWPF